MKKFQLLFILILSAFIVFSCSDNDDEELADTGWEGPHQDDNSDSLPEAVTNDEDKTDTASASDEDKTDTMSTSDEDKTDTMSEYDDSDVADDPTGKDDIETSDIDISDSDNDTDTTDDHDSDQTDQDTDPANSQPDEDQDSGSGDSQPDDDGDTSTSEPTLPECSPTSGTPCEDLQTKLIWSSATSKNMKWSEAESRCKDELNEGGFKDWRMPTISELRTLVRNCQKTATGGACKVTDECTASYSTANPQCYNIDLCTSTTNALGIERCGDKTDGSYSLLGDASVYLWSSSVPDEDHDKAWYIYFKNTNILNQKKTLTGMVRCVRKAE